MIKKVLFLTLCAFSITALADRPDHAGGGKRKHKDREEYSRERDWDDDDDYRRRNSYGSSPSITFNFGSRDADIVRDYYGSGRNCPPGLAKKGNGCMPPGQAKKWAKGRQLPRDVRYNDVPYDLRVRLPIPPAGHKYVQVAGDILLLAIGTNMVVDALESLF